MRSVLPAVARELGADERTLRRAAARGALRCHRPSRRRLQFLAGERDYLRGHWQVLSALMQALRTEPNVRLAVLYGSVARGDEHPGSDLDLLVALQRDEAGAARGLARRLAGTLGRDVEVARIDRVRHTAPLLLLQALDEGRVLVDRDGEWPELRAQGDRIASEADAALEADRHAAADAFDELTES